MSPKIRIDVEDSEKIGQVGELIRRGGVIVYPTDTLYGLGGNPLDPEVIRRILDIKR